ncbi:MAG: transposase [Pirellulales bacterium]|nr:transposase [Pirellulales bacterium]
MGVIGFGYIGDAEGETDAVLLRSAGHERRNVVERLIGRIKECRRVATRNDKLTETFRSFILLAFVLIWIKNHLSDRA